MLWLTLAIFPPQVSSRTKFWKHVKEVFVPSLYAGTHYNGVLDETSAQQKFIADRAHKLLGVARLRQVRVYTSELYFGLHLKGILFFRWLINSSWSSQKKKFFSKVFWTPVLNTKILIFKYWIALWNSPHTLKNTKMPRMNQTQAVFNDFFSWLKQTTL